MLKNIILVFTQFYIEKIRASRQAELFCAEMEKEGLRVGMYDDTAFKERQQDILREYDIAESVFMADSRRILALLQKTGCYTVACYHEASEGFLGLTQYATEGITDIEADYLHKVYQRYRGIPWEITQTKRCSIREMGPEDVEDLYELYADARITRYTEPLFQDREKERNYIEDYIENIYKYFGFGTWLIHRKEDGKLIGRAGFNYRPGYEEVELGFVIGYPFWRNGYAYEVCRHLLHLGKTVFGFDRIQALADEENTASVSLLEKLGFYYAEDVMVDGKEYRRYLFG